MDELEQFYRAYVDKLFTFCLYKTGSRSEAEDLASDAFLRFARSGGITKDNPKAFLYTIARNLIIDYYRTRKPHISVETLVEEGRDPEGSFSSTTLEEQLLVKEIIAHVNELPDDQRDVILMQYVQDLDNRTIGEIMGKSESSIKSLAFRGLSTLRKIFKE